MSNPPWDQIEAGRGRFKPPDDILGHVFDSKTRYQWAKRATPHTQWRLNVLAACGSYPAGAGRAHVIRCWRAHKAAWEAYLFTAFACGMLNGDRGNDVLARA